MNLSKGSGKKKILFRSAVLLFSLILLVFLVEIYVRYIASVSYFDPNLKFYEKQRQKHEKQSLQYEPSIFSRRIIKAQEQIVSRRHLKWHINSKGYRGDDFSIKKPEGVIRIIVFGGSAVFDVRMSNGQDWPHMSEKILAQKYPSIEVINAGIPGNASFDSVGLLFAEGHLFNPDYVVIYNGWNDIKYFRKNKSLLRIFNPMCKWDDPRKRYHNVVDRFMGRHLKSYLYFRDRYYVSYLDIDSEGAKPRCQVANTISETAIRQFRLNMQTFADVAANTGAKPVLMTQARLVSPRNTKEQKETIKYQYVKFSHRLLCKAFDTTDKIILEVSKQKGAHLIDASAAFTGQDDIFADHVHLKLKGSRAMASFFAKRMDEIIRSDYTRGKSNGK